MLASALAHLGRCSLLALDDVGDRGQGSGRTLQSCSRMVGTRSGVVRADIWQVVVICARVLAAMAVKAVSIVVLGGHQS